MRVRGATPYSELVSHQGAGPTLLENLMSAARFLWRRVSRVTRRQPRGLRLCESLSLGERRFVAVVEFESARFLLGGTSGSLVLLTKLETTADTAPPEGGSRIPASEETDK